MKENKKALLRIINRFTYLISAVLLVTSLLLGAVITPVQASNTNNCPAMKLNLSHIQCITGSNKVEVHFVLLNVPDGVTPGTLYFTLSISSGSSTTLSVSPSKDTGNAWHYSYYGTVNGTYNVTGAYVYVGTTRVDLHNPGSVSISNCVVPTCQDTKANNYGLPGACTYNTCQDNKANNYGQVGECTYTYCEDEWADNYGDIGSCKYTPCIYDSNIVATSPDCHVPCPAGSAWGTTSQSCVSLCTDPTATNYNYYGTCTYANCIYNPAILASSPDCHVPCGTGTVWSATSQSCVALCTDNAADNYNQVGTCTYTCKDPTADNYNQSGTCTYTYCSNNPAILASSPDCHVPCATGTEWSATSQSCVALCTDAAADNYNQVGTCTYTCKDPTADNYNQSGTCTYTTCQDHAAINYGENGACSYATCQDETANNFGAAGDCTYTTCQDQAASNFGAAGACRYNPPSLQPLNLSVDPYCTANSEMQWTVENPNNVPFTVYSWTLDGTSNKGFSAGPGSTKITTSGLGTHTIALSYGDGQSASLTYTLDVCPLPAPVVGGLLIPVTGADQLTSGMLFAGISFGGLGLILSALRKFFNL